MKILIVSRSWPSNERSGVSLVAGEHVRVLAKAGHRVSIVGACKEVLGESLPVVARFYVPAYGSGAAYDPARIDTNRLEEIMQRCSPDIVLVEAWQTSITDIAIDVAAKLKLPVVMLSHGISVHPFSWQPIDVFRAVGWLFYRWFKLARRIKKLSALAVLDRVSVSPRFFDRALAEKLKVPLLGYTNAPINWRRGSATPAARKPQLLVVGYFSSVKNQMAAIQLLEHLPLELKISFIGRRTGRYYSKCVALANKLEVAARVRFLEDTECDIANEIATSLIVLSPSKTEVLPLTLLEAMASGTPFVASPVGAVPSLSGGLFAEDESSFIEAILALASQPKLWQDCARDGIAAYESRHTRDHVASALDEILRESMGSLGGRSYKPHIGSASKCP